MDPQVVYALLFALVVAGFAGFLRILHHIDNREVLHEYFLEELVEVNPEAYARACERWKRRPKYKKLLALK